MKIISSGKYQYTQYQAHTVNLGLLWIGYLNICCTFGMDQEEVKMAEEPVCYFCMKNTVVSAVIQQEHQFLKISL